jgi:hypothetical protein
MVVFSIIIFCCVVAAGRGVSGWIANFLIVAKKSCTSCEAKGTNELVSNFSFDQ